MCSCIFFMIGCSFKYLSFVDRPSTKGLLSDIELESVGNSDKGLIKSTFVNSLNSGYLGALEVDSKESVVSLKGLYVY